MTVLVCDLGGTHTRLALGQDGRIDAASRVSLENDAFQALVPLIADYLDGRMMPDVAVIALAAPVEGDTITLTNRDWTVSRHELSQALGGADVHFLNDFEALGHALADPAVLDPTEILPGTPDGSAQRLVLGAGTGFNAAARLPSGDVVRCEVGHTTLAVETADEIWVRDALAARHGRCSVERVLSGRGVFETYRLLCARHGDAPRHDDSHGILAASGTDPRARTAVDLVAGVLGRVAGDLALTFVAEGGVWLNGGLTRALAPVLADPAGAFARAFRAKGRMRDLVSAIPVRLIGDDHVALYGALAWHGHREKTSYAPQGEHRVRTASS